MKKNSMFRAILLSTVFALLAIVLITPVAGAHTAAPAHGAAAATSQIPDVPNVNIIRRHGRSVFSATTVHCKARGLSTDKSCFTITNTTDKDQQVLFKGRVIVTIPPGAVASISVSSAGLGLFGLQANSHAILLVIAS